MCKECLVTVWLCARLSGGIPHGRRLRPAFHQACSYTGLEERTGSGWRMNCKGMQPNTIGTHGRQWQRIGKYGVSIFIRLLNVRPSEEGSIGPTGRAAPVILVAPNLNLNLTLAVSGGQAGSLPAAAMRDLTTVLHAARGQQLSNRTTENRSPCQPV